MKVLYLAPDINLHLSQTGGAGTHIRASLQELEKRYEVWPALGGDLTGMAPSSNASKAAIGPPPSKSWRKYVPEGLKKLWRDYRRRQLSRWVEAEVEKLLAEKGELPDIIYERSGYGYDTGMRLAAKYQLPRCMETDVIMLDLMRPDTSLIFNRWIYRRLEYKKFHTADAITVQSEASIPLMQSYWGIEHHRIYNKDLGIYLNKLQSSGDTSALDQRLGLTGKFVVGYVGVFQRFHQVPVLLEAARLLKDHPQVAFLIVGDGADGEKYRAFAHKYQLQNLIFTGLVPKEEIRAYYARMDLGAVPGCAFHMYPVKYLELGALGIPAITPRYEVFRSFYSSQAGYEAHTFPEGDATVLAQQIESYAANLDKWKAETAHVQHKVQEEHTWEACGDKLTYALEETLYFHRAQQQKPKLYE